MHYYFKNFKGDEDILQSRDIVIKWKCKVLIIFGFELKICVNSDYDNDKKYLYTSRDRLQ